MCIDGEIFFFKKRRYSYMYAHPISMSVSERLVRLDLEIHKIGHQECLTVDGDIDYH
jgi:hypothetical protein